MNTTLPLPHDQLTNCTQGFPKMCAECKQCCLCTISEKGIDIINDYSRVYCITIVKTDTNLSTKIIFSNG